MSLSFSSLPGDNFVSVDRDSLQVLLAFALAHGNVNSILSCLQILLGVCTCVCVCRSTDPCYASSYPPIR